jgi:hypothetical protein
MLTASLLLVGMDGLVKWLADDRGYHVTQIAFLRYFVCLFIALGLARMSRKFCTRAWVSHAAAPRSPNFKP